MARPGFVHDVDERTPPLLIHAGDAFRLESLPIGSRVIYAPEALPAVVDLPGSIDAALNEPLGSDPLSERLRPGMKLTIAFDDVTVPWPRMRKPDVRGRIIEKVLAIAAASGVDDVQLIVGNGLHRRITEAEMLHLVGERVFRSFLGAGSLNNHDATAVDGAINNRATESDLLVYVHVTSRARGNGSAAVVNGLGSAAVLSERGGLDRVLAGDTGAVADDIALPPIFSIEAVVDNNAFGAGLDFMTKREWEWSLRDRTTATALQRGLTITPPKARRKLINAAQGDYAVIQVKAGDPYAVAQSTDEMVRRQQLVPVTGQADVMITGVSQHTPYSFDSVVNPVLAAWMALGHAFNANTGTPVVREGGAMIIYHPAQQEFSPLHHPSYIDFFADVLTSGQDPAQLRDGFEAKYANDPWYTHLYQTSFAYHGVHPFLLWYDMARALQHCGDIIWVGADTKAVERMGFRTATTLHDALEIVAASVGRSPKITYVHQPPHLMADVS